jgi:hypothetical protein
MPLPYPDLLPSPDAIQAAKPPYREWAVFLTDASEAYILGIRHGGFVSEQLVLFERVRPEPEGLVRCRFRFAHYLAAPS